MMGSKRVWWMVLGVVACTPGKQNLGWVSTDTSGQAVDDGSATTTAEGGQSETGAPDSCDDDGPSAKLDVPDPTGHHPFLDVGGGGGLDCASAVDANEPNDTLDQATPLDINPVPASLCDNDVDYWSFSIDYWPVFVEPSISADPFGAGFIVQVLATVDETPMLSGELHTDTGQQDMTGWVAAPGEYAVRVELYGPETGEPRDYEMYVDHGPAYQAVMACDGVSIGSPCSFGFGNRTYDGACTTTSAGPLCVPSS
jgi:hypothetical protein